MFSFLYILPFFSSVNLVGFFFIFLFYLLDFSWSGSSMGFSSSGFFLLYLSFLVYYFILATEKSSSICQGIFYCLIICFFFFSTMSLLGLIICAELLLIPLLMLLLGYGAQVQKVEASVYLLIFSSICSLPGVWGFITLSDYLSEFPLEGGVCAPGFLFVLAMGFFMKLPVYLYHFWLPLVHVEAPTSTSVFLAGVLLKLGAYGVALLTPLFNWGFYFPYLLWALFGLVFLGFSCISSSDTKVFAAYSSALHMSFFFFMALSYSGVSVSASMYLLLGHGCVSSLWFYYLGLIYNKLSSRMLYMSGSFMGSSLFFFVVLALVLFYNAGGPFSYSFFGDILGVSFVFLWIPYFLIFFFVYYMCSFYFSVIFVLSSVGFRLFFYLSPMLNAFSFTMFLFMFNWGIVLV